MKKITLKTSIWSVLSTALLFTAGCASTLPSNRLQAVGPCPNSPSKGKGTGSLQVYTAFDTVHDNPVDYEMTTYMQRNSYPMQTDSISSAMSHSTSHSSYEIYSSNGSTLCHVNNRSKGSDSDPEVVSLPPGTYVIEGDTEHFFLRRLEGELMVTLF